MSLPARKAAIPSQPVPPARHSHQSSTTEMQSASASSSALRQLARFWPLCSSRWVYGTSCAAADDSDVSFRAARKEHPQPWTSRSRKTAHTRPWLGRRRRIRDSTCVHRPIFHSLSFLGIKELMLSGLRHAVLSMRCSYRIPRTPAHIPILDPYRTAPGARRLSSRLRRARV
jgi:hypothetical protein